MLKKLIILALPAVLLFFSLQIPFSIVLGSGTKFTLFDFLAPATGAFLSPWTAIFSVFSAEILNFIVNGKAFTDPANIIRLFPSLFAVYYFSRKSFSDLVIPALCIFAFILHPVGRLAWPYSMFWLIPIFAHFKKDNVFVKSLGATFTAHSVGGALWIWAFSLTPQIWLALIPQVIMERLLFAGGITASYYLIKKAFSLLYRINLSKPLTFNP